MYVWSSGCCVGQAGRKGLVNLFGTLGWQGTCRQGKVPAQSYVSTAAVLEYRYRLHCNTRDMEGKARRVQGYGYGYGYGPGAGAGTTTRYWGLGTGTGRLGLGLGLGMELGPGKQEKGGLEVGVEGGERGCGCWYWYWEAEVGGCWEQQEKRQTRVGLTIEQRLSTLPAQPGPSMMMCRRGLCAGGGKAGRCEVRPDVPLRAAGEEVGDVYGRAEQSTAHTVQYVPSLSGLAGSLSVSHSIKQSVSLSGKGSTRQDEQGRAGHDPSLGRIDGCTWSPPLLRYCG